MTKRVRLSDGRAVELDGATIRIAPRPYAVERVVLAHSAKDNLIAGVVAQLIDECDRLQGEARQLERKIVDLHERYSR